MSPSVKTNCVQGIIPLKSTFTLFFGKEGGAREKFLGVLNPLLEEGFIYMKRILWAGFWTARSCWRFYSARRTRRSWNTIPGARLDKNLCYPVAVATF